MNRRDLIKAMAAIPVLSSLAFAQKKQMKNKLIKPKRLQPGDNVALISPAGIVSPENLEKAITNIKDLGFIPRPGRHVSKTFQFLAGTDDERLEDLHWAFADKGIKAVWCIRGGYGTTRILPKINYSLIKSHPKILIGYSDITALTNAVYQKTGLVTFHGPGASSNYSEYTKNNVLAILTGQKTGTKILGSVDNAANSNPSYHTFTIRPGKCRGQLIGGNLALISAMGGTPFGLRDTKGKILFLEDVNEPPYKVDRMLTQLRQMIDMRELAGIGLGIFLDSSLSRRTEETVENTTPPEPLKNPLVDVLNDRLGDLGIPVIYGLSFGHIRDQMTLPIGIKAELDTENATVTLLEDAVS